MNLENLRSSVRFAVFGDSTDTSYGDTDLDRNINLWYKTGIAWALQINGDWQVNGEIATASIVADQREYALPSDTLKLNEVYIKTSTEYVKAIQRDAKNISVEPDGGYYPDTPEFDLMDESLFIYLPENTIKAVTNGIKIHYQTEITELSADADAPNLIEPFERLLITGAAYEYCVANGISKAEQFKRDTAELKNDLELSYSTRSTVRRIKINPQVDNNY